MATRSVTMVVDRELASQNEAGFACDPILVGDKSYVNMYLHHDGYPEYRGVELANWININARQDGSALAAELVHDNYYRSCYLYSNHENILILYGLVKKTYGFHVGINILANAYSY